MFMLRMAYETKQSWKVQKEINFALGNEIQE